MTEHSTTLDAGAAPGRGLYRLMLLIISMVWPLIWVGGLVTTYDAGMAVPDWPGTYGYNLFLYPYKTWLFGPFDLFIEHGHRLLAALVGLVAIVIVVVAYRQESRRWVFWLCVSMLVAVIFQGVLGGLRVVLSDRTLAMIHGCFGPAFFALCVAGAVVTSRTWWREPTERESGAREIGAGLVLLIGSLWIVSYGQIVLGALIRHVQPTESPAGFTMTVAQHVMTAMLLWVLSVLSSWRLARCGDLTLSRPGVALIGLLSLQVLLGVGTWVVNYGWPGFLGDVPGSAGYLIQTKGFVDSLVVTSHVAIGSLILAVSTLLLLRILRVRDLRRQSRHPLEASQPIGAAVEVFASNRS